MKKATKHKDIKPLKIIKMTIEVSENDIKYLKHKQEFLKKLSESTYIFSLESMASDCIRACANADRKTGLYQE